MCGLTESVGHVHDESCYTYEQGELICGLEEGEGAHQHTADCYETETVLVCDKEEVILHTHSDDCYAYYIAYQMDSDGNVTNIPLSSLSTITSSAAFSTSTYKESYSHLDLGLVAVNLSINKVSEEKLYNVFTPELYSVVLTRTVYPSGTWPRLLEVFGYAEIWLDVRDTMDRDLQPAAVFCRSDCGSGLSLSAADKKSIWA